MREPSPPTGSHHCKSAAASKGPDTGERGKEKGRQELTHSKAIRPIVPEDNTDPSGFYGAQSAPGVAEDYLADLSPPHTGGVRPIVCQLPATIGDGITWTRYRFKAPDFKIPDTC
ncbi:UNVERIFIED_CONTAM: hypothetical protein FKN15_073508 [Acipenser sinensis]